MAAFQGDLAPRNVPRVRLSSLLPINPAQPGCAVSEASRELHRPLLAHRTSSDLSLLHIGAIYSGTTTTPAGAGARKQGEVQSDSKLQPVDTSTREHSGRYVSQRARRIYNCSFPGSAPAHALDGIDILAALNQHHGRSSRGALSLRPGCHSRIDVGNSGFCGRGVDVRVIVW